MILVKLSGGLGNQMFQYAAARALAFKYQTKLVIDTSMFAIEYEKVDKREFGLNVFSNIKPVFSTKFLTSSFYMPSRYDNDIRKLLGCKPRKVFAETKYSFNEEFVNIKPPVLLDGYWQCEKYFKEFETIIRNDLQFKSFDSNDQNVAIRNEILANQSVSVHVRRGDYVKYGTSNMFYGICDIPYYKKAIQLLLQKRNNLTFYFFSEDPEWVLENLMESGLNAIIVNGNTGVHSWKDMYLMSLCKHHILANSSFSWWGAWLNQNPEKLVVAPSKWYNTTEPYFSQSDILLADWITIKNE